MNAARLDNLMGDAMTAATTTAHCATCGARLDAAHIVADKPVWSDQWGGWVAQCTAWCQHCEARGGVMTWLLAADRDAHLQPPLLLAGPAIVRDKKMIERFCKKHGDLLGVVQR